MFLLITGGSGSGKSAYAEQCVLQCGPDKRRFYIATMMPWGEETIKRIGRHRAMREEKAFTTLECFTGLDGLELPGNGPAGQRVALLECVSNLAANELFSAGATALEAEKRILDGIRHLQKQAGSIIIVTNEVCSDGVLYAPETVAYQRLMGGLNQHLAGMADQVVEVVYTIPVILKKEIETYKRERE